MGLSLRKKRNWRKFIFDKARSLSLWPILVTLIVLPLVLIPNFSALAQEISPSPTEVTPSPSPSPSPTPVPSSTLSPLPAAGEVSPQAEVIYDLDEDGIIADADLTKIRNNFTQDCKAPCNF